MDSSLFNVAAAGSATAASLLSFIAYRRAAVTSEALASDDGEAPVGLVRKLIGPVALQLRPTNQSELEMLSTRLLAAGRRDRDAVDRFCEEKLLAILASMVGALFVASVVGGAFGVLLSMVSIGLGILGPSKVLDMKAAERSEAVAAALPNAVDLLTTCIEAGLSLEQAMTRVAKELERTSPVLAKEFRITASEFEAGVSLPDALRRLARRVALDDLSALCGVIAQAHGLGAPVGQTLREYAASSRRTRTSMLEERAGKLAAQLTLPLAMFLLPAAMVIILGPAVIQLVRALQ